MLGKTSHSLPAARPFLILLLQSITIDDQSVARFTDLDQSERELSLFRFPWNSLLIRLETTNETEFKMAVSGEYLFWSEKC